jgi:hypothetical protein
MKKLVYIMGGQASGKMTIGEGLAKITGLKLFHNHIAVELAHHFYGFTNDPKDKKLFRDMREDIRDVVLNNVAQSSLEGIIMTFVMYFDEEEDWQIAERYRKMFGECELYCVELVCDVDERQRRNLTPHRLEEKPSKQNIERSKQDIYNTMETHRIISIEGEEKKFNANGYLKIDNTNLSAEEVAKAIKEKLGL